MEKISPHGWDRKLKIVAGLAIKQNHSSLSSCQHQIAQGKYKTNFSSPLNIFSNPVTAEATNFSDFDIRIFIKPMSIYLGLTPDALITHEKIVNLFFSLLVNENCRELPEHNPDLKYQCLIPPDEFTSMGKSRSLNALLVLQQVITFVYVHSSEWRTRDKKR